MHKRPQKPAVERANTVWRVCYLSLECLNMTGLLQVSDWLRNHRMMTPAGECTDRCFPSVLTSLL